MPRSDNVEQEKSTKAAAPRARREPAARQRPVEGQQRRPRRTSVPAAAEPPPERRIPRLLERYRQEVLPTLVQEFGYRSPLEAPRLRQVVLNIGLGEVLLNANALEAATRDLTLIAGQRPVITRARKSIAGFKIRKGMAIGLMATLRGTRMYDFLDKLMNAVLPRIRDFRGTSRTSFDGRGNYSLGLREQVSFPEIDYNSIDRLRGLQVAIVTSARTDDEGLRLLELLGMPFARDGARR